MSDQGKLHNLKLLKARRRQLRHQLTPAEARLWKGLQHRKLLGKKFRRQHSVGYYILDFYCPECRLAIELDGDIHCRGGKPEYDKKREEFLNSLAIEVLHIENNLVFESNEQVLDAIKRRLVESQLQPPPSVY
jgi:very-short-patch-repair endonuclease